MKHNRTDEAKALLAEIMAYCAHTRTPETSIGHVLFRHPGFVGLLRLRHQLSEEKERVVRQFMRTWVNGYRGELPYTHVRAPKGPPKVHPVRPSAASKLSEEEIASRRVERDSCPRCGVRRDFGCTHSGAPLGTSF